MKPLVNRWGVLMNIGIIGAGRVGCSLAVGLYKKGYAISGVYSRTRESADFLKSLIGLELPYDIKALIDESDIIFITVPDMELEQAVKSICTADTKSLTGKIFLHCSGAETSDVLAPLKEFDALTGSLHPIQTFADKASGYKGLKNIYFSFEGDNGAFEICKRIVTSLESKLLKIEKDSKALYHAAACIISNYMVTLSNVAEDMLEKAGIDRDIALKAFEPLMNNTVKNIQKLGSIKALTGPVSRGDISTLEEHLKEINNKCPGDSDLYKVLLRHTADIAFKSGAISAEKADNIRRLGE
jgi:predicted short-subunit dehydrogenase-like oxidoreductase (DUF2520 family)